ncbi:MAG: SxtJ family membrane protein [Pseudomonadales bacterium]
MTTSAIKTDMTAAELRKFGLVTGAILIGLIGCLLPWLHSGVGTMLRWLLYVGPVGGTLIVWALIHPSSLIYFYRPWMKLAEGLGFINTRIILFVLFYGLFMPMGVIMRLFGKDPMHRELNAALDSYRVTRNNPARQHMEKPY